MEETPSTAERLGIDPTIKALADLIAQQFTLANGAEYARQQMHLLTPPPREDLSAMRIEDRTVGFGSLADIPVRIYWPLVEPHTARAGVAFFHGGGFALGDIDGYDVTARIHAAATEAIVVSVGYRLAPE